MTQLNKQQLDELKETEPEVQAPTEQEQTITGAIRAFLTDIGAGHSPATVRTYRVAPGYFGEALTLS